jgi:hypothetical protein
MDEGFQRRKGGVGWLRLGGMNIRQRWRRRRIIRQLWNWRKGWRRGWRRRFMNRGWGRWLFIGRFYMLLWWQGRWKTTFPVAHLRQNYRTRKGKQGTLLVRTL